MKIATWNVNSVRSRLEHVKAWLQANPVDALCLQETKVQDADFPLEAFEQLGYHCAISGQKSYNGVAIVTKTPLTQIGIGFGAILGGLGEPAGGTEAIGDLDDQKRVLSGVLEGVRLVNLYVPNGSAMGSDKYAYKLRWLALLETYLRTLLATETDILVCGDFNIALEDQDIYKEPGDKSIATHIMSTPAERQALRQHVLDLGFADAFRRFTPEGKQFSWWDYRTAAFQRNLGWRIDHHYLSPSLCDRALSCTIDPTPRKLEKPSDHTPVIVELSSKKRLNKSRPHSANC